MDTTRASPASNVVGADSRGYSPTAETTMPDRKSTRLSPCHWALPNVSRMQWLPLRTVVASDRRGTANDWAMPVAWYSYQAASASVTSHQLLPTMLGRAFFSIALSTTSLKFSSYMFGSPLSDSLSYMASIR